MAIRRNKRRCEKVGGQNFLKRLGMKGVENEKQNYDKD